MLIQDQRKKLYCCRPSFNLDTACTDQNQVPARRQDRTRPRPAQPGAAPPSTTAVRSSCNTQCPIRQYQKKKIHVEELERNIYSGLLVMHTYF